MPRTPGLKVNGAAIKALRESNGWPSGKFAITLGIAPAHLTNIEKGARRPSAPLAKKIANLLEVPLAAIRSEHWDQIDPASEPEPTPAATA